MKAMVLNRLCNLKEERQPLALQDMPEPGPADNEILVKVSVCGVCHTELDVIEAVPHPRSYRLFWGIRSLAGWLTTVNR